MRLKEVPVKSSVRWWGRWEFRGFYRHFKILWKGTQNPRHDAAVCRLPKPSSGAVELMSLVPMYQQPGQPSPHVGGVSAYTVTLFRCGQPLGLVVTDPKPPMRNLLILETSESEVIQTWNVLHPERRIEVGHAIMAVNEKTDPFQMLQDLASAQTLKLFIKDKMTRVQQRYFDESLQRLRDRLGPIFDANSCRDPPAYIQTSRGASSGDSGSVCSFPNLQGCVGRSLPR